MTVLEALHPSPDYVSDHIRRTGQFYEVAILDEVRDRLANEPPGVLVDVGAMIGNHTVYLARFVPHQRILAVEPSPANRVLLAKNVGPYRVTVLPIALSDRVGYVQMGQAEDNRGWSTILDTEPRPVDGMVRFRARTYPLDHFRLDEVRLLKVDVEHHERQVLAGARETIARCRPLIVVEDWERDLAPVLADLGYSLAVDWGDAHQTYLYVPTR